MNEKKVAETVTKKKRSFPNDIDAHSSARPEEIAETVNHALNLFRAKPCKTDDEVEKRIEDYFIDCYDKQRLPTVEGLALALGTFRQHLWEWENKGTKGDRRRDIVKRAKATIAEIDAQLVASGKIPQIVYIFRAKNYYGMQDKTEVSIEASNPLGDQQEQKALEDKYAAVEVDAKEIT